MSGHDPTGGALTDAERRAAEWDCERLIRRYALLNDAGEFEALVALFTEDGQFARPTDPDNPLIGRDAILAAFQGRTPRTTRHLVTNVVVDVEGSDAARAISYMTLFSGPTGALPLQAEGAVAVGAFHDTLRRTAEGWRFAARRGSVALTKP